MWASDHVATQAMVRQGTQGMLAHKHVSSQGTLTPEYISTRGTLA